MQAVSFKGTTIQTVPLDCVCVYNKNLKQLHKLDKCKGKNLNKLLFI